jgi:hypothetical protein
MKKLFTFGLSSAVQVRRCADLKFQVSVLIFCARPLGFSALRSPRLWFQCYRVLPAPQLIFSDQHAA